MRAESRNSSMRGGRARGGMISRRHRSRYTQQNGDPLRRSNRSRLAGERGAVARLGAAQGDILPFFSHEILELLIEIR